ncbi:hypothetical protein KY284_023661 [Solanum tuberosum]|nr:hypothetical protein KY284_023661 [Solanum tuberosum]
MDLFGPTQTASIGGKKYAFVIVDDFSRFTWCFVEKYKQKQEFCDKNGFTQNFSSPRSPQQNGVVERKNLSLQDTARTMLLDRNLPDHFSTEADIESIDDEIIPILSTENVSNTSEKITIEESTTLEPKSTSLTEKTSIPREWRHSACYPNNFIMGKLTYSILTRASLRKQAFVALV